ncbi:ASCH domain-containing protein [Moraxella nasicaprae]|uniref:ASCH domain-containing protein n=1 Tax=Moraxella nasicaprae TaxID=2904122 RepID=A0ABY6F5D9_9GAMM|nr:ASCH domain-containing protein [Moraxella nasicaprae]UXZ05313.1 ASCH domain-containing protein [Moraxella nasicaprae]
MITLDTIDINTLPHWSFGDSPEMADELVQLVLNGKKTLTCTALIWHLEENDKTLVGGFEVITDGRDTPKCMVQLTAQFIKNFDEVDEDLARKEGEGDLSLAYWRAAHQEFFERYGVFDEKMGLLFTEFKVVKAL